MGILKTEVKSSAILKLLCEGSSMGAISGDFLEELNKSGNKERTQLKKIFEL